MSRDCSLETMKSIYKDSIRKNITNVDKNRRLTKFVDNATSITSIVDELTYEIQREYMKRMDY